jgi:hypothetical protein
MKAVTEPSPVVDKSVPYDEAVEGCYSPAGLPTTGCCSSYKSRWQIAHTTFHRRGASEARCALHRRRRRLWLSLDSFLRYTYKLTIREALEGVELECDVTRAVKPSVLEIATMLWRRGDDPDFVIPYETPDQQPRCGLPGSQNSNNRHSLFEFRTSGAPTRSHNTPFADNANRELIHYWWAQGGWQAENLTSTPTSQRFPDGRRAQGRIPPRLRRQKCGKFSRV